MLFRSNLLWGGCPHPGLWQMDYLARPIYHTVSMAVRHGSASDTPLSSKLHLSAYKGDGDEKDQLVDSKPQMNNNPNMQITTKWTGWTAFHLGKWNLSHHKLDRHHSKPNNSLSTGGGLDFGHLISQLADNGILIMVYCSNLIYGSTVEIHLIVSSKKMNIFYISNTYAKTFL